MRPAAASEMPRTAQALTVLADQHGWHVEATHAEGPWETRGKTPKTVTSIAVRMRKDGKAVAAIWIDGKFWHGLTPTRRLNAAQVKELIQGDSMLTLWDDGAA